jgi:hypothetical protein
MPEFDEKVKEAFDSEFERTRPRPGLRGRVIANAVATPRVRQRVWLTPRNFAAVGAAAAVLVVAGIGLRNATQSGPIAVNTSPSPVPLAFGKLPPPGLHPPQGLGAGGGGGVATVPYFGPATMTWAGQLPKVLGSAPVYRFKLATNVDADALATRLGGTLLSAGSARDARSYKLPGGFVLSVSLSDAVAGEPTYFINTVSEPGPNRPFTEDAARKVADAELAKRGLTPSWPSKVQVIRFQAGPDGPILFDVMYQRVIPLPGGTQAPEVDGNGDPAGIDVMVDSQGQLSRIAGILRLAEQSATYPLRAQSTVVKAAVTATPVQTGESGPVPAVTLTRVTLVYTTVSSGNVGYLEPAYLFTGTFTRNGFPYEKRVLIPALDPRALG